MKNGPISRFVPNVHQTFSFGEFVEASTVMCGFVSHQYIMLYLFTNSFKSKVASLEKRCYLGGCYPVILELMYDTFPSDLAYLPRRFPERMGLRTALMRNIQS